MARRGSSARAVARRRAQQAKATRDAARLRREKDIEAALADYFEATEQAEQIRAEARRKADRLLTDADLTAETPRQAATAAVHRLRALVGRATEVASLCGISTGEVRAVLAKPVPRSQPDAEAGQTAHTNPESDGRRTRQTDWPGAAPAIAPGDVPGRGPGQVAGTAGDDQRG
jgi:hypothetical protein